MGRHSNGWQRKRLILTATALGGVVLVGSGTVVAISIVRSPASCASTTRVVVAASPEMAPALSAVANGVATDCARIEVQSRDSAQVAESLAISDGRPQPQAWIPDSTLALRRARQLGADQVPESGPSVASSPVVLAVAQNIADGIGKGRAFLRWADVLNVANGSVVTGMPDPARDSVGVSALFGLRDAVRDTPDPEAANQAVLRRFSANTTSVEGDLFSRLPGAATPNPALTVFPASENSVIRYNVDRGTDGLVAVYSSAAPTLDYPFAVFNSVTKDQETLLNSLVRAMLGKPGADAVARADLRAAGGQALRGEMTDNRIWRRGLQTAKTPFSMEVEQALYQWAGVSLSARVQVLIDVSGSMNTTVGATGKTRMQLTLEAAEQGLQLFQATTQLRISTFATNLDGEKDYAEVLPMAPVGEQLSGEALTKLRSIKANPEGQCGLYDSILAAYERAREEWEPGRLNFVVVMTDGRNNDPAGIGLPELRTQMTRLGDWKRPIPVIGVGIGPGADEAELAQITTPSGGQTFIAEDPAKIMDVFYTALSRLSRT